METTIEVAGLRKRFGSTLGPNGAGKSTTMRVILGLDAPDAGHALIGGRPYISLRANAGAEVPATGPDALTIGGLSAERAVVLLPGHAISFSEVRAHRATLEQAYLELTKDAVEFQSGRTAS